MKKDIFILSYNNAEEMEDELYDICYSRLKDVNLYIVDNGQQKWNKLKNNVIHTTKTNISCSGGWSLIAKIAFQHMNLDKIIISNDDNVFFNKDIEQLFEKVNNDTIAGTYNRSFDFSCFAITKNTYKKVGDFDENFFRVSEEDVEYKVRCKKVGVSIVSLNKDAGLNKSLVSKNTENSIKQGNTDYLNDKWGKDRNNSYELPFNGIKELSPRDIIVETFSSVYGEISKDKWPSDYEYELFINPKI